MEKEQKQPGTQQNIPFFKMPKALFMDSTYSGLSNTAKLVYMLLLDRLQLSIQNDWTDDDGNHYIFFDQTDICSMLHISRPTCWRALKELVNFKLITLISQGAGKSNKIYLNHVSEINIDMLKNETRYDKNFNMDVLKNETSHVKNFSSNKTEYSKTEYSKTEYSKTEGVRKRGADKSADTSQKKSQRFQPPTVEEVQVYCDERCNQVDPERFVDFYQAKGWKIGKNSMKDWKAAVRNWERRDKEQKQQWTRNSRQTAIDAVNHLRREFEVEEGTENAGTSQPERTKQPDDENQDVKSAWDAAISVWK